MTLEQLIEIEDNATEVWVVSPTLHYDTDNQIFSEIVSINLGQKTKYRYIVPSSKQVLSNIKKYKKLYNVSDSFIRQNFLLLPETAFNPFITECAIYNASDEDQCLAVAAPALDDSNEVIKYENKTGKAMAKHFKKLWKIYHRRKP